MHTIALQQYPWLHLNLSLASVTFREQEIYLKTGFGGKTLDRPLTCINKAYWRNIMSPGILGNKSTFVIK